MKNNNHGTENVTITNKSAIGDYLFLEVKASVMFIFTNILM